MATTEAVRQLLEEIPVLAWWLPRALVARTDDDGGGARTGKPGSRPPVRLEIAEMLDERLRLDRIHNPAWVDPESVGVVPYLHGWVRDLAFELVDAGRSGTHPQRPTIANQCRWLRFHLGFAASLPQWEELAWGISTTHAAIDRATRAVRDDAPPHQVTCGDCHAGHLVPIAGGQWRCDGCERFVRIVAVTLPEAARIADWGLRSLQRWAKEGRFVAVEREGVRYFDLAQVRAAIASHRILTSTRQARRVPR